MIQTIADAESNFHTRQAQYNYSILTKVKFGLNYFIVLSFLEKNSKFISFETLFFSHRHLLRKKLLHLGYYSY